MHVKEYPPRLTPFPASSPPTKETKKQANKKHLLDWRLQRPVLPPDIALWHWVWLCVSAPATAIYKVLRSSLRPAELLCRWRQAGGSQGTASLCPRSQRLFFIVLRFFFIWISFLSELQVLKKWTSIFNIPSENSPRGDDKENERKRQTGEKRDGRLSCSVMQRAEGMSHGSAPHYATLVPFSAAPVGATL